MAAAMSAAIQAVWEKNRGEIGRRLSTLDQAAAAMLAGGLGDNLRRGAHSDAHKLAGSLGMFGLARGSELAREIEHALKGSASADDASRMAELVVALRDEIDAHTPARCAG